MKLIFTFIIVLLTVFNAYAETWSSIVSDHFVVEYVKSIGKAQEIQKIAEDFYPKVTSDLGYSTKRKITIWFCESRDEFNRSVNAPIQDWAAGCAYPLQARIVILDPVFSENKRINLRHLVEHEITHVIFGLYVNQYLKDVPQWFNEGLAMYESDDWSYGHYWALLTATLSNSLIPLFDISEDFPQSQYHAQIAYAQSYSIIAFMIRRYGENSLRECVRLIGQGRGIDESLAGATGIDTAWLESRWLKEIKKRYKWFSLIGSWVIFWSGVILILLIAYLRRKLKNRRILKQWEEEEKLWQWPEFEDKNEDEDEDKESESENWTYRI